MANAKKRTTKNRAPIAKAGAKTQPGVKVAKKETFGRTYYRKLACPGNSYTLGVPRDIIESRGYKKGQDFIVGESADGTICFKPTKQENLFGGK